MLSLETLLGIVKTEAAEAFYKEMYMNTELGAASLGQTQHFIGETSFCFTVRIFELNAGEVFTHLSDDFMFERIFSFGDKKWGTAKDVFGRTHIFPENMKIWVTRIKKK